MLARFQDGDESSNALQPVFRLFPAMLTNAFKGMDIGFGIRWRFDGSVFNLRRLQVKANVQSDTLNDLLFADDCSLNVTSDANIQHSVDKFSDACDNFGLTISTKKTEVMHQPAPGKPYVELGQHYCQRSTAKVVDKFTYLGSFISRNVVVDNEVKARLAKASVAFGRL